MTEPLPIKNQAVWRSRRGLLELDLYLTPFVENGFDQLSGTLQKTYIELLECDDVDLLDWMKETTEPPEKFERIVAEVIGFARQR